MKPFLFDLSFLGLPLRVPGYGFMLALGFFVATILILREGRRVKINEDHLMSLLTLGIFGALIGSRLFHVLLERPLYYWKQPLEIFYLWNGGYVFFGGLFFAAVGIRWGCQKFRLSTLSVLDIMASFVALGQVFGRIGCFLAGCCYGEKTTLPWGVTFTDPKSFALPLGASLHPTQLYQATLNFFVFFILFNRLRRKTYPGQVVAWYFLLYPASRFLVEFFRNDERGLLLPGGFSMAQIVSLFLFTTATLWIYFQGRRVGVEQTVRIPDQKALPSGETS